jgi:hypothetical protein
MFAAAVLAATCLTLVVVFLWVFTGDATSTKNRVAIGFSYLVVVLALTSPFFLVDYIASPALMQKMAGAPVGLSVVTTGAQSWWVLNIGGRIGPDLPQGLQQPGLIVPLYVVVLAIAGAAVNLTRQVPRFLADSGDSKKGAAEPQLPFPERRRTKHRERRRESWRTALLTHYMYLVSAPLLAIAAYYVLVWLGTDSRTPVVVLVSFSVGVIADPVLKRITDLGYSFIRQKPQPGEPVSISLDGQYSDRKPPSAIAASGFGQAGH